MSVEVRETVLAARQSDALRGPRRTSYNAFLDELAARGRAALDYRVTGPEPLSWLCVKHLRGRDRAIVAFASSEVACVVLLGPHNDDDPGQDVYAMLYRLVDVEPQPNQQRKKPACCGDDGHEPPVSGAETIDQLVLRARRIARQAT